MYREITCLRLNSYKINFFLRFLLITTLIMLLGINRVLAFEAADYDLLRIDLMHVGKGENADEMKVDGKVRFNGQNLVDSVEELADRVRKSTYVVVFYDAVFLGEKGVFVSGEIMKMRNKAEKKCLFVNISNVSSEISIPIVFVTEIKGERIVLVNGIRVVNEGELISFLKKIKATVVLYLKDEKIQIPDNFQREITAAKIDVLQSKASPDFTNPFIKN